jgi:anti-sigma regulatory factor (Ser/Thr protein kinase)
MTLNKLEPGARSGTDGGLRHEALFYAGAQQFAARTSQFVRDGLDADESVLVIVVPDKIELLRSALGPRSDDVRFMDMAELGRNPTRIIPEWHEFVSECHADGRGVRGIGEPIWAGRTPEELVEAQRHEALINLALGSAPAWILCPYDTDALDASVVEEARRSHPLVSNGAPATPSTDYRDLADIARPFDDPLSAPPSRAERIDLRSAGLHAIRAFVADRARSFGLSTARTVDLVVAVNEAVANSVRHADGSASVLVWDEAEEIVCDVRDSGLIADPLAGRRRPDACESGYGLWLVNQLCDLVQLRTFPTGSVVRMSMRRD